MKIRKSKTTAEIDLHGLRTEDAAYRLTHFLDYLSEEIQEVTVIHGYRQGQALMAMIRQNFTHPRIKQKLKTLNEGQTRFILKKK